MSSSEGHSTHAHKDSAAHTAKESRARRSNGDSHAAAAFMARPAEAGLSALEDLRALAAVSAENMEEHLRVLEDGWRDMSACENALDFSRAAGRLGFAYSQFVASAGRRMASLASDCVTRRAEATH